MNRSLSFVIPLYNEAQNLQLLYEEIILEANALDYSYEIIFVDDGSTDNSKEIIRLIHKADKVHVMGVVLAGHQGKGAAISAGFSLAKNEIIFTLDADLKYDPKEIYRFVTKLDEGYDIVYGRASKKRISNINCGFNAYKKEVTASLLLYGNMYRYSSVLAKLNGFKVAEIVLDERKSRYKKLAKTISLFESFFDYITITFLASFNVQPFYFFGYAAFVFFTIGLGLVVADVFMLAGGAATLSFTVFAVILTLFFLSFGVFFVCFGLISELIIYYMHKANRFEHISHILKLEKNNS